MKTVLITGASRGIGKEIALAFGRLQYNVVVNYNNSPNEAVLVTQAIKDYGGNAVAIKADVSDFNEVLKLIDEAKSVFGDIDVLVNNAGVAYQGLVQDMSPNQYRKVMSTNFDSVFYCCKKVLPLMLYKHSGRIINIASVWGEAGASYEVVYSASKAAVIGFTKALAQEVGPSGITVNCVSPGVIQTEMNQQLTPETLNNLIEETPVGRIGKPEDVADMVAFLCSEQASFITGQVIGINGGMII